MWERDEDMERPFKEQKRCLTVQSQYSANKYGGHLPTLRMITKNNAGAGEILN